MVVLVNEQTASAAEIVAGALQLHHRAVVVGTRTRGKGFMQTMYDLGRLGQVNLTTSELLLGEDRPFARWPDSRDWGVVPDVESAVAEADRAALHRLRLGEEVLHGLRAAEAPQTMPATAPAPAAPQAELLRLDRPLAAAVTLLRTPGKVEAMLAAAAARDRAAATQPSRPTGRQPAPRD